MINTTKNRLATIYQVSPDKINPSFFRTVARHPRKLHSTVVKEWLSSHSDINTRSREFWGGLLSTIETNQFKRDIAALQSSLENYTVVEQTADIDRLIYTATIHRDDTLVKFTLSTLDSLSYCVARQIDTGTLGSHSISRYTPYYVKRLLDTL